MKSETKFLTVPVGSIVVFLIFASLVLVWYPISSPLRGYLLGRDQDSDRISGYLRDDQATISYARKEPAQNNDEDKVMKGPSSGSEVPEKVAKDTTHEDTVIKDPSSGSKAPEKMAKDNRVESDENEGLQSAPVSDNSVITQPVELANSSSFVISDHLGKSNLENTDDDSAASKINLSAVPLPLPSSDNPGKVDSDSCDLYHGKWVYDSAGPVYTNNTCPIITQMQNCQGNGRPDKDYESWRWKPEHCILPRFDARKFLKLMEKKTLALIGDSVARNQMESLLCMLWQVETPKNRGSRQMHRWYFRSTSTTIIRIWSSWLVHTTNDPFPSVPDKVVKVHLDLPDESFMEMLPKFDVVVLSSGHWFAKQSAYILNNTIVGGQLWTPPVAGQMRINNIEAFGISVESCLTAIASHPHFTGLAIVRSYSPDHYEGGAWNTGGSCTGKVSPVTQVVKNEFTDVMHEKQVTGFERASKKAGGNSKLILMDITEPFGYRADGHPGPYRSPDPNKITKRGPNGEPPPQDCLHWCMPGPVDTWNEILLEIIRREVEHE